MHQRRGWHAYHRSRSRRSSRRSTRSRLHGLHFHNGRPWLQLKWKCPTWTRSEESETLRRRGMAGDFEGMAISDMFLGEYYSQVSM